MSEIKLKPCPFCGSEMTVCGSSRLKRFTISHRGDRKCHFYAFEIDWQTVDSIAEAIEAWNKRAEPENVVHAHNESETGFLCSACKFGDFGQFNHGGKYRPNYCPNCGAKMT